MTPLQFVLGAIGLRFHADAHEDAKYTAVLEQQLEFIKTRTYDIVYPEMKARQLIPVNNDVDSGAETITYRQWDEIGMAQIIANYADDLPRIDALVEEFQQKIKGLGAAYEWSIQDLRRSAMAGANLDQRRARAARRSIEQQIENIAALGNAKAGLTGFAKHPNVPLVVPITGSWASATGAQMVADLMHLASSIVTSNKETFLPDTTVLDVSRYNLLAITRISTTGDTNGTALEAFLRSNPWVTNVGTWNKLALADVSNTGPRLVCYKRDAEVLTLEIPQEFEQFPPQAKNLSFLVPVHARIGGVIVYYPLAMAYMDGT
jgi:hypothetical protein